MIRIFHKKSTLTAGAALSVLLLLGACNSQQPAANAPAQPAGQVIAKVGGEDVTIHELQNEYRRAGITPDRVNEQITRAVLEEITRRKSLAQKAKAAGLDREPTVLLDLLRSREQVLATAVLQRDIQTRVAGIGKTEVDRYLTANPERFGKRVRFDVDQMTVNAGTLKQEFLDAVKDATSLDAIEAKASAADVAFSRGQGALFTGDIPPELIERLRNRKDADVFYVRTGNTGVFFKVRGERPDPLAGEEAQQRAQVMMRNEATQTELTKKGDEVQVTYFGEYVKLMEKPAGTTGTPTPAQTTPPGQSPPATPQRAP
jgi:EpsD family peptidyl-prolyl cis-trans isomerase